MSLHNYTWYLTEYEIAIFCCKGQIWKRNSMNICMLDINPFSIYTKYVPRVLSVLTIFHTWHLVEEVPVKWMDRPSATEMERGCASEMEI